MLNNTLYNTDNSFNIFTNTFSIKFIEKIVILMNIISHLIIFLMFHNKIYIEKGVLITLFIIYKI